MAVGLHVARLLVPGGVRGHTQADCHLQTVTEVSFIIVYTSYLMLRCFRKKDVSLGSHNPLCEYHHSQQGTSQGHLSSSTNSNNYTTINYNHTQVLIIFFTLPGEQTDPGPIRILNHKSFLKIFVFAKVPDLSPVLEV